MSITNPDKHDLETAYLYGLSGNPDPEAAEELGIPISSDTAESHILSGREVKEIQEKTPDDLGRVASAAAMTAPDAHEHAALGLVDAELVR